MKQGLMDKTLDFSASDPGSNPACFLSFIAYTQMKVLNQHLKSSVSDNTF